MGAVRGIVATDFANSQRFANQTQDCNLRLRFSSSRIAPAAVSSFSAMKVDYGIDAPGVIRNLVLIGAFLLLLAWFVPVLHACTHRDAAHGVDNLLFSVSRSGADGGVCQIREVSSSRPHAENGGLAGR
jgi:hypothetical protein